MKGFAVVMLVVMIQLYYTTATNFDPKTMRLLNYKYSSDLTVSNRMNAVFRSNIPIVKDELVYDKVIDAMKTTALHDAKIILPTDNCYIIDLTLLKTDDPLYIIEQKYWESHPENGMMFSFTVHGESKNPDDYSEADIRKKVNSLSWMEDDINMIVEKIETWLNDFSGDRNIFVLVHCEHGHDRAGQISSAYWLNKAQKTWEQVEGTNYRINNNSPIAYGNQKALVWYCHHLQYERGYDHLTCTHENLSKSKKVVPELAGWDNTLESALAKATKSNEQCKKELDHDLRFVIAVPILATFCGILVLLCIVLLVSVFILIRKLKTRARVTISDDEAMS